MHFLRILSIFAIQKYKNMPFSILLRQNDVFCADRPLVMGIINVTPDSFYAGSRMQPVADRVAEMLRQGADVIDVGAYSTRPGAAEVSAEEELHRLREALPLVVSAVRESAPSGRYIPVSVDTFRAQVARTCVEQWGCDWVNDVSGGTYDPEMLPWVAESGTPYIMMHIYPTELQLAYPYGVYAGVKSFFERQLVRLKSLGVSRDNLCRKVILDPGFGFAKNLDENYELFRNLSRFKTDFPDFPLLVGVSRKSMIYRLLGTDADHALNGTTVLHTMAVHAGADILRVHDVKEAKEVILIQQKISGDVCRP